MGCEFDSHGRLIRYYHKNYMYEPIYRITHNILNNIVKFEVEKKGILDLKIDDEIESNLRLLTSAKDIFHLSHLFGLDITLKVSKKIATGKTLELSDYRGKYLTNFRNAIEYILASQTSFYSLQASILAHLNKILIKGIAEEWDSKYRISGEEIDPRDDNWIILRDERILSVEVQSQAFKVMDWFDKSTINVHPLISIPAAIYRLIRIAPFIIGNKITILAFTKYLFHKSNLSINGYLPVVKVFDIYEDEFIDSWKQVSNQNDDITLWIERFVRSFAIESQSLRESIDKKLEEYRDKNKQPFLNLNRRQLKILRYLQNIPQIKREEYVEMMDVSTMTAYRDLNELVKKGLVRVEGEGRGTRYVLASR